jgi:transposase-like protein
MRIVSHFRLPLCKNAGGLSQILFLRRIRKADYYKFNNLQITQLISFIEIYQIKYLNNLVEQDHRFIEKITKPMMGFKAFHSAQATIDGIETAHMIRKKQLSGDNIPAYKQFMGLAG